MSSVTGNSRKRGETYLFKELKRMRGTRRPLGNSGNARLRGYKWGKATDGKARSMRFPH